MANFPIYLPWDPERTDFVMRHARTDLLMLDIQLGSACNARCPRCDSSCSDLKEPASIDLDALCSLAEEIDQRHRALNQKTGTGFLPGGRKPVPVFCLVAEIWALFVVWGNQLLREI